MLRLLIALTVLVSAGTRGAEINVYAASSLTDALKEIGAAYSAQGADHIFFNFAASNILARQIEEGAPADLFFSADEQQMDRLEKNARIDSSSRRDLLSNALVIVAQADANLAINEPADLRNISRIAVGDPKVVPVGAYTRAYFEKVGLWSELESKILPAENVRAGLAIVESGNADVGVVYATDAGVSNKVKVIFRIPSEDCPAIRYPVAVVRQSRDESAVKQFQRYLTSDSAAKVFEKFGFTVLR